MLWHALVTGFSCNTGSAKALARFYMAGLVERTSGIAVTGVTAFATVNVEITIFAPIKGLYKKCQVLSC